MLHIPRHSQVDEEVAPALELQNQILAPPTDRSDALAFERGGNGLGWLGPGQARVVDEHALERSTGERRFEPRADRLDFG
jgi:hypothetical protein